MTYIDTLINSGIMGRTLTAIGLILNIMASVYLFLKSDEYIKSYISLHSPEKSDPDCYGQKRIETEKTFRLNTKIGFGLLIFGFMLQLIALFL